MVISFSGSSGTGKTETINQLKKKVCGWEYYSEPVREIVPFLGFDDPFEFVNKYGIVFHEAILLSHWCFLKEKSKTNNVCVIDRSPIDMMAYFYLLKNESDMFYEDVLKRLMKYYGKYIDHYIYFPCGKIQFKADKMRKYGYHKNHEKILLNLYQENNIDYYTIKSETISERINEVMLFVNDKLKKKEDKGIQ